MGYSDVFEFRYGGQGAASHNWPITSSLLQDRAPLESSDRHAPLLLFVSITSAPTSESSRSVPLNVLLRHSPDRVLHRRRIKCLFCQLHLLIVEPVFIGRTQQVVIRFTDLRLTSRRTTSTCDSASAVADWRLRCGRRACPVPAGSAGT